MSESVEGKWAGGWPAIHITFLRRFEGRDGEDDSAMASLRKSRRARCARSEGGILGRGIALGHQAREPEEGLGWLSLVELVWRTLEGWLLGWCSSSMRCVTARRTCWANGTVCGILDAALLHFCTAACPPQAMRQRRFWRARSGTAWEIMG